MNEDFGLSKVEELLYAKAAIKKTPIYGGFELTPYCNFSCKMCYVQENASGLPLLSGKEWLSLGRQAAELGTLCIVLTGGEPLLHPDFKEIYIGLKKMGMVITINTNASLIDDAMADFFMENVPRRINISLYGSNRDVYEELCGNPAGFDKTIRAIELLKQRNIPIKINLTPNIINYSCLEEMLKICREYDLTVEMMSYLFEPLRKLHSEKQIYRLSPEQMAKALVLWDRYRLTREENIGRAIWSHQCLEYFEESRSTEMMVPIKCRAGSSAFWICWNGKMNACVNMIRPQADVLELGFEKAWELTKRECEQIRVSAKCMKCSLKGFCSTCAAINFHQNSVFDKIPEIMCTTTECYARMLAQMVEKIDGK